MVGPTKILANPNMVSAGVTFACLWVCRCTSGETSCQLLRARAKLNFNWAVVPSMLIWSRFLEPSELVRTLANTLETWTSSLFIWDYFSLLMKSKQVKKKYGGLPRSKIGATKIMFEKEKSLKGIELRNFSRDFNQLLFGVLRLE